MPHGFSSPLAFISIYVPQNLELVSSKMCRIADNYSGDEWKNEGSTMYEFKPGLVNFSKSEEIGYGLDIVINCPNDRRTEYWEFSFKQEGS